MYLRRKTGEVTMAKINKSLNWRVNTPQLLREVLGNNGVAILNVPLQIFADLLAEVADNAIRINDKELNKLMLRLALYEDGDPYSSSYNEKEVNNYLNS